MYWRRVQLFVLERLVWIIAVIAYAILISLLPRLFLDPSIVGSIVRMSAAVGVLAIAEGVCLLSGSIDLSLPAIGGFTGVFIIALGQNWFASAPFILLILPLIVGAVLGAINGLLVGRTGVHPFLVTLATLLMFTGARKLISAGALPVYISMLHLLGGDLSIVLLLLTVLFLWLFLNYTIYGLRIYAIGGNAASARLMGINVENMRLLVHTLAGAMAGLSGLLFVGHVGATSPEMLDLELFTIFAMAVFGGIAMEGGRGNIEDVLAGIFFIGTLYGGLPMLGINPHLRYTIMGIFILIGVIVNSIRFRLRDRLLMSIYRQ